MASYRFEEQLGKTLPFDPRLDVLIIRARSPEDVSISVIGVDLLLSTPVGQVTLLNTALEQLSAHNITFLPLITLRPPGMPPVLSTAPQRPPVVASPAAAPAAAPLAVKTEPEPTTAAASSADLFDFAEAQKPAANSPPPPPDLFAVPPPQPLPTTPPAAVLPIAPPPQTAEEVANENKIGSPGYGEQRDWIAESAAKVLPKHKGGELVAWVYHEDDLVFA